MILELRQDYQSVSLQTWLKISGLPKSSFYEWKVKLSKVNQKEIELVNQIKLVIADSKGRYGYRRVTMTLDSKDIKVNHKRVYRLMKKYDLLCRKFTRRSRKFNSYKGEVGKIADNLLDRNFNIDTFNKVWVTDVTEFKVRNRRLYLSPIMDLYNGEIIAYNTSTHPTVKFTTAGLDKALKKLPGNHSLMIHSDQGFHYQNKQWVKRLEKHNIKQSMSRKGNCIDNAPMENFFGILKQEMYYGEKYKTVEELEQNIKEYIKWYNQKRIKCKLKGLSPVQYRQESLQANI